MIRLNRPACPNPQALHGDYRHPTNKAALIAASAGKCMYCESRVTQVYWGDVEHIQPKSAFLHLEFDWDNLGFVCAKCNNAKLDKWYAATPFINPYTEDPTEHLVALGAWVHHRGASERGEITWREIALNRPELLQDRQERIIDVSNTYDKAMRTKDPGLRTLILDALESSLDDSSEYALFTRAAFARLRAP